MSVERLVKQKRGVVHVDNLKSISTECPTLVFDTGEWFAPHEARARQPLTALVWFNDFFFCVDDWTNRSSSTPIHLLDGASSVAPPIRLLPILSLLLTTPELSISAPVAWSRREAPFQVARAWPTPSVPLNPKQGPTVPGQRR